MAEPRQWITVSRSALWHNLAVFRRPLRPGCRLMAVVKANAYGHGLAQVVEAVDGQADVLGVDSLAEGDAVRDLGSRRPVVILGHTPPADLGWAAERDMEPTIYDRADLAALQAAARRLGRPAPCHLKLETGLHRQGLPEEDLDAFLADLAACPGVELRGVGMHFANIEDTTDPTFARHQLAVFQRLLERVGAALGRRPAAHAACSAAACLYPETHFDMVRVGIGLYGLWPSRETYLSALLQGQEPPRLQPALRWATRLAQVKGVAAGESVGYGCAWRATHPIRLAVLPIGYYDGYDRRLTGHAQVLVGGRRAPVIGRVCMNMTLIDVTDVPGAAAGDEAVLLGRQGEGQVTADELAAWGGTIHYETVARLGGHIPRRLVE